MSAEWGNFCAASACGRKAGSPIANANGASIGADKCGITALLNSMSKFDNTKHMGVINNMRFTKELFKGSIDKVEAVLKAFYDNDSMQTNLCVIGKDDLENAMVHPENYQNLLVRIGGFSARFVTLNPVVQREIIERTTYGAVSRSPICGILFLIFNVFACMTGRAFAPPCFSKGATCTVRGATIRKAFQPMPSSCFATKNARLCGACTAVCPNGAHEIKSRRHTCF